MLFAEIGKPTELLDSIGKGVKTEEVKILTFGDPPSSGVFNQAPLPHSDDAEPE